MAYDQCQLISHMPHLDNWWVRGPQHENPIHPSANPTVDLWTTTADHVVTYCRVRWAPSLVWSTLPQVLIQIPLQDGRSSSSWSMHIIWYKRRLAIHTRFLVVSQQLSTGSLRLSATLLNLKGPLNEFSSIARNKFLSGKSQGPKEQVPYILNFSLFRVVPFSSSSI